MKKASARKSGKAKKPAVPKIAKKVNGKSLAQGSAMSRTLPRHPFTPPPPAPPVGALPMKVLAPPKGPAKPAKAEPVGPLEHLLVPSSALRAAALCAGKDDVRYYLNGVYVVARGGSVELVATNGHMLALVGLGKIKDAPKWLAEGLLLSNDLVGHCVKLQKDGDLRISYAANANRITVTTHPDDWATLRGKRIEGKFPEYVRIMEQASAAINGQEASPLAVAGFNPAYIKICASIAAELSGEKNPTLHIFQAHQQECASVVTFGATVSAAVYVMPVRGDAMGAGTMKLLSPALSRSAAALRAHITRQATAAKTGSEFEKKAAQGRKADLESRLATLMASAGKQIEHKKEAEPKAESAKSSAPIPPKTPAAAPAVSVH